MTSIFEQSGHVRAQLNMFTVWTSGLSYDGGNIFFQISTDKLPICTTTNATDYKKFKIQ